VQYRWVVESPAPGIIDRQSVFEPLQTGVISIDFNIGIKFTCLHITAVLSNQFHVILNLGLVLCVFCIFIISGPLGQVFHLILEIAQILDQLAYISISLCNILSKGQHYSIIQAILKVNSDTQRCYILFVSALRICKFICCASIFMRLYWISFV
jgi:hypothetical protein